MEDESKATRKLKPINDYTAIAEQLVRGLAAKLEAAGYPGDILQYNDIGLKLSAACTHLVSERETVVPLGPT